MKKCYNQKKKLATVAAILCLTSLMPLSAWAETINTVTSSEELTKSSTVYVGEVVVDGVSVIKYLYSGDMTIEYSSRTDLLDCLRGMADDDYADLLEGHEFDYTTTSEGFAICADATIVAAMNENWSSAQYVGTMYYPGKTVTNEVNSNLYDIDNGFKAVVDTKNAERMAAIDNPIDNEKCIVFHIVGGTSQNIVWYEVVDGQIVKHVDTYVTYSCEATTVIYTKVELETPMTETPLTFEAVEDGTITVYLDEGAPLEVIQYKLNGAEWTDVTWNEAIALSANDVISFRGDNGTCCTVDNEERTYGFHFEPSNDCYVYGNMMSLIDQDDYATNTTLTGTYNFFHLFQRSDYEPNTAILNHPIYDIVLPATTLAPYCYDGLFADAPNISRAPELPATTLTDWCYSEMFSGTAITTAPALPATTLAEACFADMFMNCTSLTTAPDLPAATLAEGCYTDMFAGCTSLNYVKCLATDISADYCTTNWLYNVSATGTFVKSAGMDDWTVGPDAEDNVNGIPEGWTVETIDVFNADGNWDVATNWSGNAVPAEGSDVAIMANATVPSGYTANAGDITIYGTLTIADGGQLIHSNAVNATLQKDITGYTSGNDGWYTIASPVDDAPMSLATTGTYDLYAYDEESVKWLNQKVAANGITAFALGNGYLYANSADKTLAFTGEMPATNTANFSVALDYSDAAGDLKGYNLVGNPFTRNLTNNDVIKIGDTDLTSYYYVDGGTEFTPALREEREIKPGEGFIVQASEANQNLVINYETRGEQSRPQPAYLRIEAGNDSFTDRAYVQIGSGNTLRKMSLNDNTTKLCVMHEGKDYAAATIETMEGELPLNFMASANGSYTITVTPKNVDMEYLHLVDNMTGADVDLLRNPSFAFEAKTSDYASRFRLVFKASGIGDDGASTGSEAFAYISDGNLVVNGEGTLQVVDVTGRIVLTDDANRSVSTNGLVAGVYVIRLVNGDNVRTQKIVVK